MIAKKIDLDRLTPRSMINLFKTFMVDDVAGGEISRIKARDHIEQVINDTAMQLEMLELQARGKKAAAVWGTTEAQLRAHEAAMNMAGGPAGPPQT